MLNDPFVPIADDELIEDDDFLIEKNLYNRDHGFFGVDWPQHYFRFGGDSSGNAYYFDLSLSASPVFFADHEAQLYTEDSPNFANWLERLKKDYAKIEAEEAEEEATWEARRTNFAIKKWWQFWK